MVGADGGDQQRWPPAVWHDHHLGVPHSLGCMVQEATGLPDGAPLAVDISAEQEAELIGLHGLETGGAFFLGEGWGRSQADKV